MQNGTTLDSKVDDAKGVFVGAYDARNHALDRSQAPHYMRSNGPEHVLAYGGPKSGKTVGLVLPTLLTWKGTAVVYDPDGTTWERSAGYRRALGQKVFVFDPANPKLLEVAGFNPLAELRLGTARELVDAQGIAAILTNPDGLSNTNRGQHQDQWDEDCRAFMTAVVLHCCYRVLNEENRPATLADVADFFTRTEQGAGDSHVSLRDRLAAMRDYPCPGYSHPVVNREAQKVLDMSEREQTSLVSTVISYLTLYRDPAISANTSRCDWRCADIALADQHATVYLVARPSDAGRLRPLMRMVLSQIIHALVYKDRINATHTSPGPTWRNHRRVLLMLDDFTSLRHLPALEESLPKLERRDVKAYLVAQDAEQVRDVYGPNETVTANCDVKVFYPSISQPAAASIVARMGRAAQMIGKDAIAAEITQLDEAVKDERGEIDQGGDVFVLVGGEGVFGKQSLYFQDPILQERAAIQPPTQASA